MVTLGAIHWIYIVLVTVVIVTMAMRRDTVLPCIIGLFVVGMTWSGSRLKPSRLCSMP